MTRRQKIFTGSVLVTLEMCEKNAAAVALVPVMSARLTKTKDLLRDFDDAELLVMNKMKGVTESKEQSRLALMVEMEFGLDVLRSLAFDTGDAVLKAGADYGETELARMQGFDLMEVASMLKTRLEGIALGSLLPYGFEAGDLSDFTDKLTDFEKKLYWPETGIKLRKAGVEDRNGKYKKLHDFVKEVLDTTAGVYRKKDPHFYVGYKICRKLHKQGGRKKKTAAGEVGAVVG